jgi:hypothetical protein
MEIKKLNLLCKNAKGLEVNSIEPPLDCKNAKGLEAPLVS